MRWYKKAQVVRPYEPAPADTPVEVVNAPVRQVTSADMDWTYGGRDPDGEKIYDPLIVVTYKDGERFRQRTFYGGRMEELIKEYHDWCKTEGLIPVPPRSFDYEADIRQTNKEWEQEARQKTEAEEDRRFQEETEATEGRLERGEKPVIP